MEADLIGKLHYFDKYQKPYSRIVCWWSAGITSAVATKLALEKYENSEKEIVIAYCDTGGEHSDNYRFLADCEKWYGKKITVLKNEKYDSIWDVFEKTRYLSGVRGARCTTEMKKNVRKVFENQEEDLQIFGFDASEEVRIKKFCDNNFEVRLYLPLIEHGLKKNDCLKIVKKQGIDLPAMYKMGYKNNNCIGCVKGQMGYWNKIREDFPEVFERMSQLEQQIGAALCKTYAGDGKRKRVFLKDLPKGAGRYESDLEAMTCGLVCGE